VSAMKRQSGQIPDPRFAPRSRTAGINRAFGLRALAPDIRSQAISFVRETPMRQSLFPSRTAAKPRSLPALRRRPKRRPAVEALEERLCLSGYLLVSSFDSNSVMRYDESTGAFVDAFVPKQSGGLREPMGVLFGPDHNLYVASGLEPNSGTGHKEVLRYDGTTGALLGNFADDNQVASSRAILFGPDGNLYAADGFSNSVVRYDGKSGAFMDDFVIPNSGGLSHPVGMVFGPDGDLYVGTVFADTVLRYEGPDGPNPGAFLGTFVSAGSGGLSWAQGMVFGPDGNLYVASGNFVGSPTFAPGSILRYGGPFGPNPGALLGTFVPGGSGGLNNPVGLLFGPDGQGDGKLDLYVTSAVGSSPNTGKLKLIAAPGTSEVLRYDGTTGAFLGTFVAPDSGGLNFPSFMTFSETDPTTLNYVAGPAPSTFAVAHTASSIPADLVQTDIAVVEPDSLTHTPSKVRRSRSSTLDLSVDIALSGWSGLERF
jgi:hypothetical protein